MIYNIFVCKGSNISPVKKKIITIILVSVGVLALGILVFYIVSIWNFLYTTSEDYLIKKTQEAVLKNDVAICKEISEPIMGGGNKDKCRRKVAIENKNIAACNFCFDEYFKIYNDSKLSECDKVTLEDRNECVYYFNKNIGHSYSICKYNMSGNFGYIGQCFIDVAVYKKDGNICSDNSLQEWFPGWRDNCYYEVAEATKNGSLCELVSNTKTKNTCYYEVSSTTKDKNLCQKIVGDNYLKDACLKK